MSPETIARIAYDIELMWRDKRSEERWYRSHPNSVSRTEGFERINWWKDRLKELEAAIPGR